MNNFVLNEGYQKNKIFDGAKGSYIFLKNKKYLDLGSCSGAIILGHNTKLNKKIFLDFCNKNISNISIIKVHFLYICFVFLAMLRKDCLQYHWLRLNLQVNHRV